METIKITCPECKHQMEYWTRNNFINCTKCKARIEVEPCVEREVIDLNYLVENNIVFIDEVADENDDYWLEYFEDEECTIKINDIDEFVRNYNAETIEVQI